MRRLILMTAVALLGQEPTFKVESKLVIVNVSARDRSGNPITNLKKEDFEVLEDGVRQAIGVFELQKLSNKLRVVEEFTDDRERLITTLRKMSLGEGSDLAGVAATDAEEGDDSGSFTADETEFNIFNTDRKLTALEDAARKLSIYPEKKALVYFSSGVNKTGVENQSQLKATVNAAVRANVAFYPVDSRGLVATPPGGDASTASPRGTGVLTGSRQQSLRNSFNDSQETLY